MACVWHVPVDMGVPEGFGLHSGNASSWLLYEGVIGVGGHAPVYMNRSMYMVKEWKAVCISANWSSSFADTRRCNADNMHKLAGWSSVYICLC